MTTQRKGSCYGADSEEGLTLGVAAFNICLTRDKSIIPENHPDLSTVSPMRCEYASIPWMLPIRNAKNVSPVALLIFKSGLNRIILIVGSSPLPDEIGAATPDKMFLMLATLPEIETSPQIKSSSLVTTIN